MKKLMMIGLVGAVVASCQTRSGHVTGVLGRPVYNPQVPLGTQYIPGGSFMMGQSDEDVPFLQVSRSRSVTVNAFYMDQTEISNNEYRQFVYWVRDSIARRKIFDTWEPEDEMDRAEIYRDKYLYEDDGEEIYVNEEDPDILPDVSTLDWDWKFSYQEPQFIPLLEDMYLPQHERFYRQKEIDTRKLIYEYYWIDLVEAARKGRPQIIPNGYDKDGNKMAQQHREIPDNQRHPFTQEPQGRDRDLGWFNKIGQNSAIRGHEDRSRFIIHEKTAVYPDTLCWVHDFTYTFHDPLTRTYFWHPGYDNYPVVGVTWVQAKAFCVWSTQLLNTWLREMGDLPMEEFRLPTEAEWEYGARGSLDHSPYPWGGPYIRNAAGCFLGNFKPMRGRYMEDGGIQTVKVYSYNPNGYGLYCMAGNVAEWTETTYDESMYEVAHDLDPEYRYYAKDWDPPVMKRKVIRGGSWKDIGYYMQTGTRTYEYRDTAKSYVGFRRVMWHIGRGGPDIESEGSEFRGDINLR